MSFEEQVDDEINKLLAEAEPCTSQTFENMLDYIEQRSITYRMFRNEFSAPPTKGRKTRGYPHDLPNNGPIGKPKVGKRPFALYYVPLPLNRSLFTVDEMRDMFAVFTATEGHGPTASQILAYSRSVEKLKVENTEFLSVVKQRWSDDQWSRTSVVKNEVAEFVAAWWKNRLPRARDYPQTYKQVCSISLSPSEHQVKLELVKNLYTTGRPARYWSNPNVRLSHPSHSLHVAKEMMDNEIHYGQSTSSDDVNKKPLSQDKIAEGLALDNHVQLVLTPSTLATLLSSNPLTYEESWCLPFVVKEYQMDMKKAAPAEHARKVIYFDKKFAPESLTAVQKNRIYAKYAVRTIYLRLPSYWEKLNKENTKTNEEVKSESEEDKEADWSYGTEDKAGSEDSLSTKLHGKIFQKQVRYNLWECSAADPASVLSKHHKKPFKILIRAPVRGQVLLKNKNPNPDADYPMNQSCTLLPKLDYQPEYGAQIASFSEMTKEWIHAMLRPYSILHRVRVDPVQGNTIMIEQKTMAELGNDCIRIHSRSMQNQLSVLQNLFDALGNLHPGNYVLNHQVRDHGFMFVYHEQKDQPKLCSKTTMNLSDIYNGVNTATTAPHSAPWVPIDTGVMTPTFHTLMRIPCVFAPVKSEGKKRQFVDATAEAFKLNKKRKAKRNRKKRLTVDKKTEAAADAAAADKASKTRKRIPYHDVDSVTNE